MSVKLKMDSVKSKRFSMDAVDLEIEGGDVPKVEAVLSKIKEAAEVINVLEKENEAMIAEKDQMMEEKESMKKENEELMDEDSERVQNMVEEKKQLEDAADECGIKKEDRKGMKKRDLKIAIIKSKSEKFDASGKSDDYINVRFDFIKDSIEKEKENNNDINSFRKDIIENKDSNKVDPRAAFIKASQEMSKKQLID